MVGRSQIQLGDIGRLEREVPSLQSPFRFALDADAPAASAADVLCVMPQTIFGMEQRRGSVARYITFGTRFLHITMNLSVSRLPKFHIDCTDNSQKKQNERYISNDFGGTDRGWMEVEHNGVLTGLNRKGT